MCQFETFFKGGDEVIPMQVAMKQCSQQWHVWGVLGRHLSCSVPRAGRGGADPNTADVHLARAVASPGNGKAEGLDVARVGGPRARCPGGSARGSGVCVPGGSVGGGL